MLNSTKPKLSWDGGKGMENAAQGAPQLLKCAELESNGETIMVFKTDRPGGAEGLQNVCFCVSETNSF